MWDNMQNAVDWALKQNYDSDGVLYKVTKDTRTELSDKITDYFNNNNIHYDTFSFGDLKPFL